MLSRRGTGMVGRWQGGLEQEREAGCAATASRPAQATGAPASHQGKPSTSPNTSRSVTKFHSIAQLHVTKSHLTTPHRLTEATLCTSLSYSSRSDTSRKHLSRMPAGMKYSMREAGRGRLWSSQLHWSTNSMDVNIKSQQDR